jgi:hypothetical protein
MAAIEELRVWLQHFLDPEARKARREARDRRLALGAEMEERAARPRHPIVNAYRTLSVGHLVDWLHARPAEERERDGEMLRALAQSPEPHEAAAIAAAGTLAGFEVPGGLDVVYEREGTHYYSYGAASHIPLLTFLDDADVPDSEQIYARLAERMPDDVRTPIGLGGLARRAGDLDAALVHTRRAIELSKGLGDVPPFCVSRFLPEMRCHEAWLAGPAVLDERGRALAEGVVAAAESGDPDAVVGAFGGLKGVGSRDQKKLIGNAAFRPLSRKARFTLQVAAWLADLPHLLPMRDEVGDLEAVKKEVNRLMNRRGWKRG